MENKSSKPLLGFYAVNIKEEKKQFGKFQYIIINQESVKIEKVLTFIRNDQIFGNFLENSLNTINEYIQMKLKSTPIPVFLNQFIQDIFLRKLNDYNIENKNLAKNSICLTLFLPNLFLFESKPIFMQKNEEKKIDQPFSYYSQVILLMNKKNIYLSEQNRNSGSRSNHFNILINSIKSKLIDICKSMNAEQEKLEKLKQQELQQQQQKQQQQLQQQKQLQQEQKPLYPLLGLYTLILKDQQQIIDRFQYIIINQEQMKIEKVLTFNRNNLTLRTFVANSMNSINQYIQIQLKSTPIPVFLNNCSISVFLYKLKECDLEQHKILAKNCIQLKLFLPSEYLYEYKNIQFQKLGITEIDEEFNFYANIILLMNNKKIFFSDQFRTTGSNQAFINKQTQKTQDQLKSIYSQRKIEQEKQQKESIQQQKLLQQHQYSSEEEEEEEEKEIQQEDKAQQYPNLYQQYNYQISHKEQKSDFVERHQSFQENNIFNEIKNEPKPILTYNDIFFKGQNIAPTINQLTDEKIQQLTQIQQNMINKSQYNQQIQGQSLNSSCFAFQNEQEQIFINNQISDEKDFDKYQNEQKQQFDIFVKQLIQNFDQNQQKEKDKFKSHQLLKLQQFQNNIQNDIQNYSFSDLM